MSLCAIFVVLVCWCSKLSCGVSSYSTALPFLSRCCYYWLDRVSFATKTSEKSPHISVTCSIPMVINFGNGISPNWHWHLESAIYSPPKKYRKPRYSLTIPYKMFYALLINIFPLHSFSAKVHTNPLNLPTCIKYQKIIGKVKPFSFLYHFSFHSQIQHATILNPKLIWKTCLKNIAVFIAVSCWLSPFLLLLFSTHPLPCISRWQKV